MSCSRVPLLSITFFPLHHQGLAHILFITFLYHCVFLNPISASRVCSLYINIVSFFVCKLFIYFWLHWVFVTVRRLSLVVMSGLLISMASPVAEHRLQGVRARKLWCTGLVAPQHVESSWTRYGTCVPCIGRQIFIHCTTREVSIVSF